MKWHSEKRKIKDLIPYPQNPRQMTDKQNEDLKKSLEKFDLVEIPAIDTDNKIISGHQRLRILTQLGRGDEEIDVRVPDRKLTEEEFKEYLIRANKNTGQFDFDELANNFEVDDLKNYGFDRFDLGEIYFDDELVKYGKDKNKHSINDEGWENSDNSDGIRDLVGYDLLSVWGVIQDINTETGKYFFPLPINTNDKSRNRVRYSRTHPGELEKIVKTYMRKGDFFLESCVGWAAFSSVAKFYGYSGVGIDIWDVSLEYCKKQLANIPGLAKVEIKEMDALDLKFPDNNFDIVYCNPPFFNLEGYKQSKDDISVNSNYNEWCNKIKKMSQECFRVLKPNGLAIFTMADFRKDGVLVDAHNDWTRISKEIGFVLWDHAIQRISSMSIVTRKRNYKKRYCVKGAEHILVFKKILSH